MVCNETAEYWERGAEGCMGILKYRVEISSVGGRGYWSYRDRECRVQGEEGLLTKAHRVALSSTTCSRVFGSSV